MKLDESGLKLEQSFLIRKMAFIIEEASKTYDLADFFNKFAKSDFFYKCFDDETIFSQSPKYVLALFFEECKDSIKERTMYEEDIAYWMGYLIGEWYTRHFFNPRELTFDDIEWLRDNFDTLHTQSVRYVYNLYNDERCRE